MQLGLFQPTFFKWALNSINAKKLPTIFFMLLSEIIELAKQRQIEEDDYIEEIWKTRLTAKEKVLLSLELFDLQPTYHVLTNMWLDYRIDGEYNIEINKIIYKNYQTKLSGSADLRDSMEYSLFFDILQDDLINIEAWNYFLDNSPNETFIRIMLSNAQAIPYSIKDALYQKLITNDRFHPDIYKSIRNSCTYRRFYEVEIDKPKALKTISKLNLTGKLQDLDSEKGREKYQEIMEYLSI